MLSLLAPSSCTNLFLTLSFNHYPAFSRLVTCLLRISSPPVARALTAVVDLTLFIYCAPSCTAAIVLSPLRACANHCHPYAVFTTNLGACKQHLPTSILDSSSIDTRLWPWLTPRPRLLRDQRVRRQFTCWPTRHTTRLGHHRLQMQNTKCLSAEEMGDHAYQRRRRAPHPVR